MRNWLTFSRVDGLGGDSPSGKALTTHAVERCLKSARRKKTPRVVWYVVAGACGFAGCLGFREETSNEIGNKKKGEQTKCQEHPSRNFVCRVVATLCTQEDARGEFESVRYRSGCCASTKRLVQHRCPFRLASLLLYWNPFPRADI